MIHIENQSTLTLLIFDLLICPNSKRLLALLQVVLKFSPGQAATWMKARAPILCAHCGAVMVIVKTQIRTSLTAIMAAPTAAAGVR